MLLFSNMFLQLQLFLLVAVILPAIYNSFSIIYSNTRYSTTSILMKLKLARCYSSISCESSPPSLSDRRKRSFTLFSLREPVVSSHRLKTNILNGVAIGLSLGLGSALLDSRVVNAVQGTIKPSSLEEAKAAAALIQRCLKRMAEIDTLAKESNYDAIGKILASADFLSIESAFTVLVRSDAISADEKIALGTIKRYGLVADALIMLGGLSAELKAGGIDYAPKTSSLQQSIEDDEDTSDSDEVKSVNGVEVRKYIGLSKGSLQDIFKIVQPILAK